MADGSPAALDRALVLEIIRVAPTLHKAGTFSATVLEALARHAGGLSIRHSAETGSGASTLLFSHLSPDHTVFALDAGTGSIRSIESSPLLRPGTVTFVEGPTQLTLPRHTFADSLQLALIDGPHAYPFPDLEYYYLYQHLDENALLIVDDIHIPTITNLFDFLAADEMFVLDEVVETTAFFRRTAAQTFYALGDGWWMQGYNKRAYESAEIQVFRGPSPEQVTQPALFCLDRLGSLTDPLRLSSLRVSTGEPVVVAGWALDVARLQPAVAVDLILDGVPYRAPVGVLRPDVATAHGSQRYLRSGFNVRFPPDAVSNGSHELEFRIVVGEGRGYVSGARVRFEAA